MHVICGLLDCSQVGTLPCLCAPLLCGCVCKRFNVRLYCAVPRTQVAPTDIEEGMRVGVDRNKYQVR